MMNGDYYCVASTEKWNENINDVKLCQNNEVFFIVDRSYT